MIVGRSKTITGPYLDKDGKPLNEGGGTLLAKGDENFFGVGHNSTYTFDGKDYLIYHAYDAKQNGRPILQVKQLQWDKDLWPTH